MKFQLVNNNVVDMCFNSTIISKLIEMIDGDNSKTTVVTIPDHLSVAFRNHLAFVVVKRVDITVNSTSIILNSSDRQICGDSTSQITTLLQRLQLADLLKDDSYLNFVWLPMLAATKWIL